MNSMFIKQVYFSDRIEQILHNVQSVLRPFSNKLAYLVLQHIIDHRWCKI